jgi:hypothetical protein
MGTVVPLTAAGSAFAEYPNDARIRQESPDPTRETILAKDKNKGNDRGVHEAMSKFIEAGPKRAEVINPNEPRSSVF